MQTLLKHLAGCKWDFSRNTLIIAYKMYIKPDFSYCNEVLVSASESTVNKFEITQTQTMCLITRAVKSIPIAAMRLLVKFHPKKYEIQRNSGILLQKLCRLRGNSLWGGGSMIIKSGEIIKYNTALIKLTIRLQMKLTLSGKLNCQLVPGTFLIFVISIQYLIQTCRMTNETWITLILMLLLLLLLKIHVL